MNYKGYTIIINKRDGSCFVLLNNSFCFYCDNLDKTLKILDEE